jgi:nucleotide sugar dehydrogenase
LAVQYAKTGQRVTGADKDAAVVDSVNQGSEPFPGEKHLDQFLRQVVQSGNLRSTQDTAVAVSQSSVTVVVVPVFVDATGAPELQHMIAATSDIGRGLQRDSLVIFETTLPMGTTRQTLIPVLESTSGMKAGSEFSVAYSPERVLTGRVFEDLKRYPKLVGGLDARSTEKAIDFYSQVLDFDDRPDLDAANGVWDLGTLEAAELAKLMETTYRDVNIALANQFALFAEGSGIDVYKVIDACNSQPFSHVHKPGIAVGGHCIPIYPRLYLSGDPHASVVAEAREANERMPEMVVKRLEREVGTLEDRSVVVLGASYRGGVKETAFSGTFPLARALEAKGAQCLVHDPLYTSAELAALGFESFARGDRADIAVLQADHEEYRSWGPGDIGGLRVFFDGRNLTQPEAWPGIEHLTVGVGSR